jgi:hypothetical protein
MFRRSLYLFAASAVAALAVASPAAAGGCCECIAMPACPPAEYLPVLELPEVTPIYVVNHGPVYTGPGIVSAPMFYKLRTSTAPYPYIGHEHYYGYPRLHRRARVVHYQPRAPRRWVRPPLDPRDK